MARVVRMARMVGVVRILNKQPGQVDLLILGDPDLQNLEEEDDSILVLEPLPSASL